MQNGKTYSTLTLFTFNWFFQLKKKKGICLWKHIQWKAELLHTVGTPAYLLNSCHDNMLNRLFHHHYGLNVLWKKKKKKEHSGMLHTKHEVRSCILPTNWLGITDDIEMHNCQLSPTSKKYTRPYHKIWSDVNPGALEHCNNEKK